MATKSKITIHEQATKIIKGIPTLYFKTIKTNGTEESAAKAVIGLKNNRSPAFEVRNSVTGRKTVYKKLINSTVYEVKHSEISK